MVSARSIPHLVVASLCLGLLLPLSGCGGGGADVEIPRVQGKAAKLQYTLVLKGEGQMKARAGEAVKNALTFAGFGVGEEKDADVKFELSLAEEDAPTVFKVMVNGKQTNKELKVTATLRALDMQGEEITQTVHEFTVGEDDEMIAQDDVAELVKYFSESEALSRYAEKIARYRADAKAWEPSGKPTTPKKK